MRLHIDHLPDYVFLPLLLLLLLLLLLCRRVSAGYGVL
jgi:hypothetical protein